MRKHANRQSLPYHTDLPTIKIGAKTGSGTEEGSGLQSSGTMIPLLERQIQSVPQLVRVRAGLFPLGTETLRVSTTMRRLRRGLRGRVRWAHNCSAFGRAGVSRNKRAYKRGYLSLLVVTIV